jgi:hypothetical protein
MLGYPPGALVGTAFTDLLGVGSRIHYETHFAAIPLYPPNYRLLVAMSYV